MAATLTGDERAILELSVEDDFGLREFRNDRPLDHQVAALTSLLSQGLVFLMEGDLFPGESAEVPLPEALRVIGDPLSWLPLDPESFPFYFVRASEEGKTVYFDSPPPQRS